MGSGLPGEVTGRQGSDPPLPPWWFSSLSREEGVGGKDSSSPQRGAQPGDAGCHAFRVAINSGAGDQHMAFASAQLLAAVVAPTARWPPLSVVLTDWLSMMPALGVGSRPAR